MIRKTLPVIRMALISSITFFLSFGSLPAGNFLNKDDKNTFISKPLRKNRYKIEVQTVRFLERQQSGVNGLVESFRGTSRYTFDLFTRGFCYGSGGVLDCQSFTYDSAISAIAYSMAGQQRQAQKILDTYKNEFYRIKNGYMGLCNSYRTDAVDKDGLKVGVDAVRIHLGPNMWVSIAALHYTALTENFQYLGFVLDMAKWARQLRHWEFEDGTRGAVSMGYGWGPDWEKIYSTENNIDYYAALAMLKDIYLSGDPRVSELFEKQGYGIKDIETEMKGIERWLKEVAYDPEERAFIGGYNEKGINKTRVLDTISWTIAAVGPQKLLDMEIDPFELMDYAEKHFLVINDVDDQNIEGFDFTDPQGRKNTNRLLWVEGTGIHTVAYQVMARYAKKVGRNAKAEEYRLKAIKYSDEMEKLSASARLIDNSLPYTSKRLAEKEILFAYAGELELPRGKGGQWVASASSTVWRYFALSGFNPLAFNNEIVGYKVVRSTSGSLVSVSE